MITFRHRGSFSNTEKLFNRIKGSKYLNVLDKYGQMGVRALAEATPKDSGKTASSWSYEITSSEGTSKISWINTNINQNVVIAIILQYGHGTGTGGYVSGRDYINPAMQPIFDQMADSAWKEVIGK